MAKIAKTMMLLVMLLVAGLSAAPAGAVLNPESLPTDARIKTVPYSKDQVFRFLGHYGYQSLIEFDPDEEIMTISIGDSISWQLQPAGSRLFLKPIEQDAVTNMTVITTQRTYHFELHAEETSDISDDSLIFVLRFSYPEDQDPLGGLITGQDAAPDLTDPEVREKLNFNYSIVGPDIIAPIRIFDDGEFTYFQFRNPNADVPAFFLVDPLGNESLINFRVEDEYIVVERVSARYTLRHGAYVLCVYNDAMSLGAIPEPEEESWWHKVF